MVSENDTINRRRIIVDPLTARNVLSADEYQIWLKENGTRVANAGSKRLQMPRPKRITSTRNIGNFLNQDGEGGPGTGKFLENIESGLYDSVSQNLPRTFHGETPVPQTAPPSRRVGATAQPLGTAEAQNSSRGNATQSAPTSPRWVMPTAATAVHYNPRGHIAALAAPGRGAKGGGWSKTSLPGCNLDRLRNNLDRALGPNLMLGSTPAPPPPGSAAALSASLPGGYMPGVAVPTWLVAGMPRVMLGLSGSEHEHFSRRHRHLNVPAPAAPPPSAAGADRELAAGRRKLHMWLPPTEPAPPAELGRARQSLPAEGTGDAKGGPARDLSSWLRPGEPYASLALRFQQDPPIEDAGQLGRETAAQTLARTGFVRRDAEQFDDPAALRAAEVSVRFQTEPRKFKGMLRLGQPGYPGHDRHRYFRG